MEISQLSRELCVRGSTWVGRGEIPGVSHPKRVDALHRSHARKQTFDSRDDNGAKKNDLQFQRRNNNAPRLVGKIDSSRSRSSLNDKLSSNMAKDCYKVNRKYGISLISMQHMSAFLALLFPDFVRSFAIISLPSTHFVPSSRVMA
jgi:hypothetical protein